MSSQNEIVLYQPDDEIKIEVRLDEETVWLTQAQMAELFETTPQNVTMHIQNIYKEGELNKDQHVRISYNFARTTPPTPF